MSKADDSKSDVQAMYSSRALNYDQDHGGWHMELARDFVKWVDPQPGEVALDLACGTGLVTIPLAERVGPTGKVIGVDMTPAMVKIGRDKLRVLNETEKSKQMAVIEWELHDMTRQSLLSVPSIQKVLDSKGGFDIISVCSALVLLPDVAAAIRFWADSLLRKGGRMIIDVPTEARSSQLLFTYTVPVAVGLQPKFSQERLFVKDRHSLEHLYKEAGLKVEQTIYTKSYLGETWYKEEEGTAMEVFQKKGVENYRVFWSEGNIEDARKVWLKLWPEILSTNEDGELGFRDGHWLYVTIGSKP